ncbi:rod shape-determining protein MreD [Planktosalinus lacus]|uniref:Rod shape-determining protein MreD n=1 Tax=Planktosalinus lacus TaxID=1526573 RepID=A0A8J2Y8Y7_9FLAO|nr:rod shape-determining protein MreD [Planktosalinus lacus]GGD86000.1 rod shape-determining protein MreD [Planktosalinus lacus]
MNNPIILHTVRFVLLVLAQVFVFNNINLFGYINPSVYLLFLILFPVKVNRSLFLFLGFLLGLTMDFFNNTGGIHAAACLLAAYARPLLLKYSFGVSYEYNTIKIDQTPMGGRLSYITSIVVIHHLLLYFLEVFNLRHTLFILKSTFLSSIFTILMVLVIMILFSKKQR